MKARKFAIVMIMISACGAQMGEFLLDQKPLRGPTEPQWGVDKCLGRCKYMIGQPVGRRKCEECCREKEWDRHVCPPAVKRVVIPEVQSKWDIQKKLLGKNLRWAIPKQHDLL